MPWLETIATVISSIVGGLIATLLAAYLPRRTVAASSREAFMFALKDYENAFSELLDKTKKYILLALSLQYIAGLVPLLILFSILRASPALIMIATTCIIFLITISPMFAAFIIDVATPLRKSNRSIKSALNGIINNASPATFTAVGASVQLLSIMISDKLPWQFDLAEIIWLLVTWLFIAYFPKILDFIFKYIAYFKYDETIPWDLELANIWLSDPDIRRGDSANRSPIAALFLDNGQKVEGRLVRVKVWGMILEDTSKRAKLYIRWERIVTVELMAATN